MFDLDFLRKVVELKRQTFTNAKVAETLNVSVSTVKRSLTAISRGALIEPMRKWALTGDDIFLAEEMERLRQLRPNLKVTPLQLAALQQARSIRFGILMSKMRFDPGNDEERNFLKRYNKAVLEGRTFAEGF